MKTFNCPICKKAVEKEDNSFFPFCSERCKLIDLGAWLDGKYVAKEESPEDKEPDQTI
ncbi:MAG: DNA gyrase inhibitor YacG [Nitrospinota bacterium]|nr:DNA gyrase inhibitor YacG [Nitrospinota bacterium]